MGSGFSCQSWLSHEPMRGSPCPSGSFAYTLSLPRIPFWFCGPVAFLVSTVLPRSSPVDGSVAAHKTAWQRWHCFQLLANLLSAEMSAAWNPLCLFALYLCVLEMVLCGNIAFGVWQLRRVGLWRTDWCGVSSWTFQEGVKRFRYLLFENLPNLQVLLVCLRVLLSLLWWFIFRE